MGNGMHKRGSEEHNTPPSPHSHFSNFSWLLTRSQNARKNSDSTPAPTSAAPRGGGPQGPPPAN